MRAETYTEPVLAAMKASGCIGACFGIESMSDLVLESMNKQFVTDTIEQALSLTYRHRINCNGNLIFGSEAETFETMYESIAWHEQHAAKYHNRSVRHFSYVQTYPGSLNYQHACKRGIIPDRGRYIASENWNLNITSLSQEEYDAMGDVICLLRMENYNCGEILKITFTGEDTADFSFRCSYCGNVNHYHRMNRKKFDRAKIRELGCRHCNMLGEYLLKPEEFLYDQYYAIPWFLGRLSVTVPEGFFRRHEWHKIVLFGMNAFAKKMIALLKQEPDVTVICICGERLRPDIDYHQVPQTTDPEYLKQAELIIHADMSHRLKTQQWLANHTDAPILLLETLLRMWIGLPVKE